MIDEKLAKDVICFYLDETRDLFLKMKEEGYSNISLDDAAITCDKVKERMLGED